MSLHIALYLTHPGISICSRTDVTVSVSKSVVNADAADDMASIKYYLKLYSLGLGCAVSFASFVWVLLILYILSQTDPNATDLLMARYLDISFGLLAFTSSAALLYGAFVESKSWLSVWTLGSATVLVGVWTWYFYRKYGPQDTPESMEQTQLTMLCMSVAYALAVVPVLGYYKYLESPDVFLKPCKRLAADDRAGMRTTTAIVARSGYGRYLEDQQQHHFKTKDGYRISIPVAEDLYNPV